MTYLGRKISPIVAILESIITWSCGDVAEGLMISNSKSLHSSPMIPIPRPSKLPSLLVGIPAQSHSADRLGRTFPASTES
jgi:hypothetical protein